MGAPSGNKNVRFLKEELDVGSVNAAYWYGDESLLPIEETCNL